VPVRVEKDLCIGCEACISVCPVEALIMEDDGKAFCQEDVCIDCGACIPVCPTQAIVEV
jgi:Fe-S-cluster-containing hydrogenase component 2